VITGTYSIPGTVLTDSGLDALKLDLMQETRDGEELSESQRATQYLLVYTGTPGQIFFSPFISFTDEDRATRVDLTTPYDKQ